MKKIFSVKEAAKILNVSTNTMYKYLNEGTVLAKRGAGKGSFHVPLHSLEIFLGTKLDEHTVDKIVSSVNQAPETTTIRTEELIEPPTPPVSSLAQRTIRFLLLCAIIALILDIFTSQNFSIVSNISRIVLAFIFFLIAYQYGGFVKK